jgi:hypothetical protein
MRFSGRSSFFAAKNVASKKTARPLVISSPPGPAQSAPRRCAPHAPGRPPARAREKIVALPVRGLAAHKEKTVGQR